MFVLLFVFFGKCAVERGMREWREGEGKWLTVVEESERGIGGEVCRKVET